MFQVIFKDLNGNQICSGNFETEELANKYINNRLSKPFCIGRKAKEAKIPYIVTNTITPEIKEPILDENGIITGEYNITPATFEEVVNPLFSHERASEVYEEEGVQYFDIAAEYTYEIVDLSQDYDFLLQECYRVRKAEYGSIEAQMDEQFHDFEAWKARIQSVKDKYPKP